MTPDQIQEIEDCLRCHCVDRCCKEFCPDDCMIEGLITAMKADLYKLGTVEQERDYFEKAFDDCRAELTETVSRLDRCLIALRKLRNEAAGTAGMYGLRELIGNSNLAILEQRIAESEAIFDEFTEDAPDVEGQCHEGCVRTEEHSRDLCVDANHRYIDRLAAGRAAPFEGDDPAVQEQEQSDG